MTEILFDTPGKIQAALNDFKSGLQSPIWILMCKILDGNIEEAKRQLEEGTDDQETKASIDRIRDRLKIYRDIRNTPEMMIRSLEEEEADDIDTDPYYNTPDEAEVDKG